MKSLWNSFRSFFPRRLPTGMKSFDAWVKDAIEISGLPDNPKIRSIAANFIFAIPPGVAYMSIRRISNILVKVAANQVASEVLKLQKEASEEQSKQSS